MADLPKFYGKTMIEEDAEHVYPDVVGLKCTIKIYESGLHVLNLSINGELKEVEINLMKSKMQFLKDFLNEIPDLK